MECGTPFSAGRAGRPPPPYPTAAHVVCDAVLRAANGCGIGCDRCDGVTRGPIPTNLTGRCVDTFSSPPQYNASRPCAKMPACAIDPAAAPATNCDPSTRSINRAARCGAATDYW
jgi:hypothetical protein